MRRRASLVRAAAFSLALVLAWSCSSAPRTSPPRPLPAESAGFLLDPSSLASAELAPRLANLHRRLLAGEPFEAIDRDLAAIAADGDGAVELLRAEIEFVAGRFDAARHRLAACEPRVAESDAARLLATRLDELDGRAADAFEGYSELATRHPVAAGRRDALREPAVRQLRDAIERSLGGSDVDAARRGLERLRRLEPRAESTLRLAARVAAARGDGAEELAAVRELSVLRPGDRPLALRRGLLEIEVGDAGLGLSLLQRLVEETPGDEAVASALAGGRFLYRLANAPEPVRAIARRFELTRADFARLLYWLEPSVRAARPAALRIAADALDHPAREEIVRVANLGLMRIDEALHAFEPDRALARSDAFIALDRLRGGEAVRASDGCRFALASGWIASTAECLPAGPVTGAEAVRWIREADAAEGDG